MNSRPIIPLRPQDITRFWSKVQRLGDDDCWEWQGKRDKDGYGQFCIRRDVYVASRVAFTLSKRPLLPDELACHECDNPPCCNPAHLRADDQSGNRLDAILRNRHWYNIRRLTATERDEVAAWHAAGVAIHEIARQLRCSRKTVRYHVQLRQLSTELRGEL